MNMYVLKFRRMKFVPLCFDYYNQALAAVDS